MIDRATLQKRHRSGSGWFYTIGFLSLLNLILQLFKASISFPVGLGVASMAGAFFAAEGTPFNQIVGGVLFFVSFVFMGLLFLSGLHSREGKRWAYLLGGILYGFDLLVCLLLKAWVDVAFHAWGLYSIGLGFLACGALAKLPEGEPEAKPEDVVAPADAAGTPAEP